MRTFTTLTLAALFSLLGGGRPLLADDNPDDATSVSAAAAAIARYRASPPAVFRGEVRRKAPAASSVRTVLVGMGGSGKPFEGSFEAWSPTSGEDRVLLLSEHDVPGFGIRVGVSRTVTESRSDEAAGAIDVASMTPALAALLDADRLTKWLGKAKWKRTRSDKQGSVFEATVSRRIVPASAGGNAALTPVRVLAANAHLHVSPSGDVRRVEIRVKESDPLAALRSRAVRDARADLPSGLELDDEEQDVGKITTYILSPSSGQPSKRIQAFDKRIAAASVGSETR